MGLQAFALSGGVAARMVVSPSCDDVVVGYRSTNKTVYSAVYHIFWCPSYRRRVLAGRVEARLKEIIAEVIVGAGGEVIEVEVMPDHVHLLVEVPPAVALARLVEKQKGCSSRMLRAEFPPLRRLPAPVVAIMVGLHGGWRSPRSPTPLRVEPETGGVNGQPLPALPRALPAPEAGPPLRLRQVRVELDAGTGQLLVAGTADAGSGRAVPPARRGPEGNLAGFCVVLGATAGAERFRPGAAELVGGHAAPPPVAQGRDL